MVEKDNEQNQESDEKQLAQDYIFSLHLYSAGSKSNFNAFTQRNRTPQLKHSQ